MPQCESCKTRGIRYRCKKCVKYFFELIPKTKYGEINTEKEKIDKYKNKGKQNNKRKLKSKKNVEKSQQGEDNEKESNLEIEKSYQCSTIENKIDEYIQDYAPYGFYVQ